MSVLRARVRRGERKARLRLRIEGAFGTQHSFGHVAREMALAFQALPDLDLRLWMRGPVEIDFSADERLKPLLPFFETQPLEEVDFHIRHEWPPTLEPPPSGRWILAQP